MLDSEGTARAFTIVILSLMLGVMLASWPGPTRAADKVWDDCTGADSERTGRHQ